MQINYEKKCRDDFLLKCGDEYHTLLNWLATQDAIEVLDRAYEYLTKRTILYYLEDNTIPVEVASVLLNSKAPLDLIYKKYTEHSKDESSEILSAIKEAAIIMKKESSIPKVKEAR